MRTLLLLCFAALGFAATAPGRAADTSIYAEYMHESGLWTQIAGFEAGIQMGLAQVPQLTREQSAQLSARMSRVYEAGRLRVAIERTLTATLPASDAQAMLVWYATPLGTRLARAEEEGSVPETYEARQSKAAQVLGDLAPPRKARLERLLRATGSVDFLATLIINQSLGVARGVAIYSGRPSAEPAAALKAQLELSRAQLAGAMLPRLTADVAMIYEGFSDAELDEYNAILESPAGLSATKATNAAVDKALSDAAVELGRGISEDMNPPTPRNSV